MMQLVWTPTWSDVCSSPQHNDLPQTEVYLIPFRDNLYSECDLKETHIPDLLRHPWSREGDHWTKGVWWQHKSQYEVIYAGWAMKSVLKGKGVMRCLTVPCTIISNIMFIRITRQSYVPIRSITSSRKSQSNSTGSIPCYPEAIPRLSLGYPRLSSGYPIQARLSGLSSGYPGYPQAIIQTSGIEHSRLLPCPPAALEKVAEWISA